jgi:hypothetical protein
MTPDQVIERLRNNWELANRGTGWWLSEPRRDYQRCESIPVDDSIVNHLEKAGLIAFELPYTTLWAKLTPAAADD